MLYRIAIVQVYGIPERPRIVWQVRLTSDIVVLGGRPIETGRAPIELPTAQSPKEWLREALEQFPQP